MKCSKCNFENPKGIKFFEECEADVFLKQAKEALEALNK